MALQDFTVEQLAEDLRLQDETMVYCETQLGGPKNRRYMQELPRVRLGMQTSPEYYFYDNGTFTNFQWVDLNAVEYTMAAGAAEAGVYDVLIAATTMVEILDLTQAAAGALPARRLGLSVQPDLIETVEIATDANGFDTIHLSLKASNKPDFTFVEFTDPVGQWRFHDTEVITDAGGGAAAYRGDNNYVLNDVAMLAVRTAVLALV